MKRIECCRYCVAPKRHLGCHETCPEYNEERKQLDEDNDLRSQKHYEASLVPKAKRTVWRSNKR